MEMIIGMSGFSHNFIKFPKAKVKLILLANLQMETHRYKKIRTSTQNYAVFI